MTVTLPALCRACVHLDRTPAIPGMLTVPVVRCDAYPQIPAEIARDGGDHRQPRGDEHDGVIFELHPDRTFEFQQWSAYAATTAPGADQAPNGAAPQAVQKP